MQIKTLLKNIITRFLAIKARKRLDLAKNCQLVLLIGDSYERQIYKESIKIELEKAGKKSLINLPGYNHRLGISLTVLGQKAGTSGLLHWVQLLFSKPIKLDNSFLIFDYSLVGQDDINFISELIKPSLIILTGNHANVPAELIELLFKYTQEKQIKILKFGDDVNQNLSFYNLTVDDLGQHFDYKVLNEQGKATLNNYGVHYIYPFLISKYILNVWQ